MSRSGIQRLMWPVASDSGLGRLGPAGGAFNDGQIRRGNAKSGNARGNLSMVVLWVLVDTGSQGPALLSIKVARMPHDKRWVREPSGGGLFVIRGRRM